MYSCEAGKALADDLAGVTTSSQDWSEPALIQNEVAHLASSNKAFWRYCSSGTVGSQLCSSKYDAIPTNNQTKGDVPNIHLYNKYVQKDCVYNMPKMASVLMCDHRE